MREMNDQTWYQRIKPVEKWLENFKPTNEDDDDKIQLIKTDLRRGKRTPSIRKTILEHFKAEFSEEIQNGNEMFADWWPTHRHTQSDPQKCGYCRRFVGESAYSDVVQSHKKVVEFVDSHEVMDCKGCDRLFTLDKSKYADCTQEILPLEQLDGHDCCPHCGELPSPQVMKFIHAFFENYGNAIDYQCTKPSCSKSISTLGEAFEDITNMVTDYQIVDYMDVESTPSLLLELQKDDGYPCIQFAKDLIISYAKKEGDNDLLFCEPCLDGDFDPGYFD